MTIQLEKTQLFVGMVIWSISNSLQFLIDLQDIKRDKWLNQILANQVCVVFFFFLETCLEFK